MGLPDQIKWSLIILLWFLHICVCFYRNKSWEAREIRWSRSNGSCGIFRCSKVWPTWIFLFQNILNGIFFSGLSSNDKKWIILSLSSNPNFCLTSCDRASLVSSTVPFFFMLYVKSIAEVIKFNMFTGVRGRPAWLRKERLRRVWTQQLTGRCSRWDRTLVQVQCYEQINNWHRNLL